MLDRIKQGIRNLVGKRKVAAEPREQGSGSALLEAGWRSHGSGDLKHAEECYLQLLQDQPANLDALYLLGRLRGQQGQLEDGLRLLKEVVARKPSFAEGWSDLGNVHTLQGNLDEAEAAYRRALELEPEHAGTWLNLGTLLVRKGLTQEAEILLGKYIYAAPAQPEGWIALGNLQFDQKRYREARDNLLQATVLVPRNGHVALRLALSLQMESDFDEAIATYGRAMELMPDSYEVLINFGSALHQCDRLDEAIAYYEKALIVKPDDPVALNNIGWAMQNLGKLETSLALYDRALKARPDYIDARFNRAIARLLTRDYANAWEEYELRKCLANAPRIFPPPYWDGSEISGKSLLVYAEQGLGDEIMFASCFPDVIAHAGRCIIECDPRLEKLFARSFPAAEVIGKQRGAEMKWLGEIGQIDACVAAGTLPFHYRRSEDLFPSHHGYLQADPERMRHWQEQLSELGPGLKVGLSWRGGTTRTRNVVRSIGIAQWLPLLGVKDIQFVSLQYTDCSEEIAALEKAHGLKVHHWQEALTDYDETAALLSALDLVISVCTSVIHLGGALGKPVWVMVPASPEWRYGSVGAEMPWYPSVKLFRQEVLNEWEPVIARVADKLQQLAKVN